MKMKEVSSLYSQSPKLNRLNILKEIAADSKVTQAKLAKLCSISVAMVNNYMKDLCRNGFLEYRRRSLKSVTYYLTPSGIRHLHALQLDQISEMAEIFDAAKERIMDCISSQLQVESKRLVLFGSGSLAQLAFHALESTSANVIGVCSDDLEEIGRDFCGREVMNSSRIYSLAPDAVIFADVPGTEEVFQELETFWDQGAKLIHLSGSSEFSSFEYLKLNSSLTAVADPRNP